jgi:hypothetical protein
MHASPPPPQYPPYGLTTFTGGEYSHPHVDGYPVPAYPNNAFDGTDGSVYPQPMPSPNAADDYTTATQYT